METKRFKGLLIGISVLSGSFITSSFAADAGAPAADAGAPAADALAFYNSNVNDPMREVEKMKAGAAPIDADQIKAFVLAAAEMFATHGRYSDTAPFATDGGFRSIFSDDTTDSSTNAAIASRAINADIMKAVSLKAIQALNDLRTGAEGASLAKVRSAIALSSTLNDLLGDRATGIMEDDIKARLEKGKTPLMQALENKLSEDILLSLIEAGDDETNRASTSENIHFGGKFSALDYARHIGRAHISEAVERALVDAGVDHNVHAAVTTFGSI